MADHSGEYFGQYQLIRFIKAGGFGEVYLGKHEHLQTQVAVKLLYGNVPPAEEAHFQEEARKVAHLRHPHIIRVLDFSVQANTPYLVMDYAPGGTLLQRFPLGTPVSVETILPYVQQVAEALQHAHDQGVIHLDVKPDNMLLDAQGQVLLADFGIARVLQCTQTHVLVSQIRCTPAYASPEQLQQRPGLASDQYALATVVYRWLTGALPFETVDFLVLAWQKLQQAPPSLCARVPTIAPEVETVVLKALAVDPHDRFASVQVFATALEQASLRQQPTSIVRPAPALPPTPPAAPAEPAPAVPPAPTVRAAAPATVPALLPAASRGRHRWVMGLLVGLLALVVVSGSLLRLGLAGQGSPTTVGSITEFALPTAESGPWGITAGPDGNLWFTESSGNRIGRITPGGSIMEFALPTAKSGPWGITAGPDGNLWFTEESGNRIGRITPTGQITEFPLAAGGGPTGITAGPDGNLWFTEYEGNRIRRITRGGSIMTFTLPSANGFSEPSDITAGPDGNLWFTEDSGNRIGRITPGGSITEFAVDNANGFSGPWGITAGPDGNLWFTECVYSLSGCTNSQFGCITPAGQIGEFSLPNPDSDPGSITVGPDGSLWFIEDEFDSYKIGRITSTRQITEFPLVAGGEPIGITAGPDGNLWFTEDAGNRIGRITSGLNLSRSSGVEKREFFCQG